MFMAVVVKQTAQRTADHMARAVRRPRSHTAHRWNAVQEHAVRRLVPMAIKCLAAVVSQSLVAAVITFMAMAVKQTAQRTADRMA